MKLKQIFMLLGAVLLGLTACSKDTPNTPDLSKTLAGTEWECVIQGTEQENGEKDVFTLLLRFVDDTKFTTLGIQKIGSHYDSPQVRRRHQVHVSIHPTDDKEWCGSRN